MADRKDALSSLSPLNWEDLPSSGPELEAYLKTAFAHAERVLNSIPYISSTDPNTIFTPTPANSAKHSLDTLCDPSAVPLPPYPRDEDAIKAHGKHYKLSAKDNPLGVNVYKFAAHDRRGAWFARRSVHQGLGFEKWRKCAQREFAESLGKGEGAPGVGSVRGVRADRRVERKVVDGLGTVEVWQTSSAFGPVTPRESVTLVISSTTALSPLPSSNEPNDPNKPTPAPRHFLLISRPTSHPSTPNRHGLVKMAYESAEMIREIPIPGNGDLESNPVEWLMITRSDPGGGIPKFLVERGTPGSIAGDVGKFLEWAVRKDEGEIDREIAEDHAEDVRRAAEGDKGAEVLRDEKAVDGAPAPDSEEKKESTPAPTAATQPQHQQPQDQSYYASLKSTAASYLPTSMHPGQPNASTTSIISTTSSTTTSSSSTASTTSFHSTFTAHDRTNSTSGAPTSAIPPSTAPIGRNSSLDAPAPTTLHKNNKEIQKLLAKRAALTDKHRADRAALTAKTQQMRVQAEGARAEAAGDDPALSKTQTQTQTERHAASSQSSLSPSIGGSGKAVDGSGSGNASSGRDRAPTTSSTASTGTKASSTSTSDPKSTKSTKAAAATATAATATAAAGRSAKETKALKKSAKDAQRALERAERDQTKREARYHAEIVKLDGKRVKEEAREGERERRRREREEKDKEKREKEEEKDKEKREKEEEKGDLAGEVRALKGEVEGVNRDWRGVVERMEEVVRERDSWRGRAEAAEARVLELERAGRS